MKYKSTRGSIYTKTAPEAIIAGLAEDKGLYVPDSFPQLPFKIEDMQGKTYKEIAFQVMKAFFPDYTDTEMKYCVDGAYDGKFEAEDVVPLVDAADTHFLELYHGRTAAFKDMALSILPYLLTTAIKKEKEDHKICILTATSGDTGKAALEGFADVEGTEIIVFYPNEGVSEVQERQMVSQEGANTHVFAINGNFDNAQSGVKAIFNDDKIAEELAAKGVKLSSANSINIGRLVPQVAYYVYAYKMGIPVNRFICASNENKVLTDFINTGVYDIRREFHLTNSPSMDILISSNLERLLYHLSGDDGEQIKALMEDLDGKKVYEVSDKIKEGLKVFYGGFATVEETNETIGKVYKEAGYLMDTHTAVAYKVYEDYKNATGDKIPAVIASTASPYKFADSVAKAIGLAECKDGFEYVREVNEATGVPVPSGLKDLDKKPVLHTGVLDIDQMAQAVKDCL